MIRLRCLGFNAGRFFALGICGSRYEVCVALGWRALRVRWAQ